MIRRILEFQMSKKTGQSSQGKRHPARCFDVSSLLALSARDGRPTDRSRTSTAAAYTIHATELGEILPEAPILFLIRMDSNRNVFGNPMFERVIVVFILEWRLTMPTTEPGNTYGV